jgi:four helix bundle protein
MKNFECRLTNDEGFMRKYDLENRLIDFAVFIIKVVDQMPNSKAGNHLANQLVRSGTSSALNYGEAQSAESSNDFIHKMSIILKELRETFVCLKLIKMASLNNSVQELEKVLNENNELIAIFVKSIETARKNRK